MYTCKGYIYKYFIYMKFKHYEIYIYLHPTVKNVIQEKSRSCSGQLSSRGYKETTFTLFATYKSNRKFLFYPFANDGQALCV